jgi:hypothetical protein
VKLPRDLSGQRVVQALKRLGFIEERQALAQKQNSL